MAAFSDGVFAIIITIMVLELKAPKGADWPALMTLFPVFFSYVLSFLYVAIYWNNHHHLAHSFTHVDALILWANTHLLFWLSLIPFATAWMGENDFAPFPTAVYGVALLMPALSYNLLQRAIIRMQGPGSALKKALGSDVKGPISILLYAIAAGLAFVYPEIAGTIYILVALMWLVPDRRIATMIRRESRRLENSHHE